MPVLQHVARIAQLQREVEPVVGPAETLTPTYRQTEEHHILVRVVVVLVVIVTAVAHSIEVAVVVAIVVGRVVVVVAHIGLLREECTQAECVGAFPSEPGIHVVDAIGLIVSSVRLSADAECLAVTHGHHSSTQSLLAEEVCHAEVAELQADTTDDTRLSITERELNLVVALAGKTPVDVDSTVHAVWFNLRVDVLVEVSERCQLAIGTHKRFPREEVAGFVAKFPADDILIDTVVTHDANMADVRLRTFVDANLQVDRVTHNVCLYRVEFGEDITIVIVKVADGSLVSQQSFVEELLVVDISLLHS